MNKMSTARKYMSVFVLSLISSSLYLLPYVKYVFYDALKAGLNATNEQLGLLLTVYAVVCAIGYIPGGFVSDRFSAKSIIIISTIATAVLNFVLAFVMNYYVALVIWALLGLSTSFAYWGASIKAIRILGDSTEQGKLYGFFQAFEGLMNTVSAFVAMGIFMCFASQTMGLKYTLMFYGVMCFIAAIALYFVYDEKQGYHEEGEGDDKIQLKDIGTVIKMPQTWMLAFTIFSIYAVYSGSTYLTPYVTDVIGITAGLATTISIFRTYVARFVFCPVGGFISDKSGQTAKTILWIAIGSAVTLSAFLFLSSGTNKILVVALIMLSAAIMYMNYGIMWAVSDEIKIPRHLYGTAVGVASVLGYLPDSFMHAMFGSWLDNYGNAGYKMIFCALIGLCMVSVVTALWVMFFKKKNAGKAN